MFLFKASGATYTRVHEKGVHAFQYSPAEVNGDELILLSKNKKNCVKRRAVNDWIRTSNMFDGVIDFEAASRDPSQPDRFLPAFDSGDHLHPSDAGYKAMGDSIDLALFRRTARLR